MIETKRVIGVFEVCNSEIDNKILELKSLIGQEEQFWEVATKVDLSFWLNERGFNLLGDVLQLVDSAERLKSFSLEDIEKIYRLLIRFHPDNVQYRIDLIEFVYRVLGDEIETKRLSSELKDYLKKKEDYLDRFVS